MLDSVDTTSVFSVGFATLDDKKFVLPLWVMIIYVLYVMFFVIFQVMTLFLHARMGQIRACLSGDFAQKRLLRWEGAT